LEDGGGGGSGVGRWQRCGGVGRWLWAAVEGCSSGVGWQLRQEKHATMILASASSKLRATITMSVSALGRAVREDASNASDVHWQGWQGDMSITVVGGSGGSTDTTKALTRGARGDNGARPAQARQG
jgi:hypothetical protein